MLAHPVLLFGLCLFQLQLSRAAEYSYDREYDTGFCMQLLGESRIASDSSMAWPRQSFTVQMYLRPLVDKQDTHFFQVVNNPVEFQAPQGDLSVASFGELRAPSQENVFMAMYHYETLYLEEKAWNLVSLVWDQYAGEAFVYVNDERVDAQAHPTKSIAQLRNINRRAQNGHIFLGRQRWQQKTSMEIDDVRVFRSALSAQDILDIYSQRNVPWRLSDDLLLEWRFDEPLISNISDSSLNGRSGTVFRKDRTTDGMGSNFVQYRPVQNVRFDRKSTAKVPSRSGLASNARDGIGALSPAYTRLSSDAFGNPVTLNTSTAIAIVQGDAGQTTVFNLRLLPTSHRMTVSALPSHGTATQVSTALQNRQGVSYSNRAITFGDMLESDGDGFIRMRFEAHASLVTAPQRTDVIVLTSPEIIVRAGSTGTSAVGTRLAEVEQVRLLLLYNKEPVASNIYVDVLEDSTTLVGLGQAGEIGAGGTLVQADTEGQQVTAIITRVPDTGMLYQVLPDGSLGVQIVQDNLPLDVAALGSSVAYVPPADLSGSNLDTISFRLRDDIGRTSDPANVTFSVAAVHDQPTPGSCPSMTQLMQNVTGLSVLQQDEEDEWLSRNCIGMCPADRIQVEEDGSIFFRLEQSSIEDSLVMVDIVSAPLFGSFQQVMTSSRNQNPLTAPTRTIDLAAAQGSLLSMWAQRVLYYSSSFGDETGARGPQQILGAANVYPAYGDAVGAWGPAGRSAIEYLELEFGERVYVTGIDVYETWFPGHVTQVSFRHPDGTWIPAWKGEIEATDEGVSRIFSPRMCSIPFPTSQVRLDLTLSASQATLGNTFPQIDAVLLVGTRMPPPGRLLFTPGQRTGVSDVGSGADGSSDWGATGGSGSGGSTDADQLANSGGGSIGSLVETPPASYWVKYLPDPDYSGVDRLVYATNDCKFDSEFRGTQRPCKEVQLNVQATNDPPVLLNPWTLPSAAATGGLLGESEVNATIAVIENQEDGHDDLAQGDNTNEWRLSARVEADECSSDQAGVARSMFGEGGQVDSSDANTRAVIESALAGCGASLMLRAKDPDVRQGDLRFDVVLPPSRGTLKLSDPLRRNTTLNLRIDAASYAETLGLSGSHVNDFVTACSILDQNALAEAIGLAASSQASVGSADIADGMDDSIWASASGAAATAAAARSAGRRLQRQLDGEQSLGPNSASIPRASGWRGAFTGKEEPRSPLTGSHASRQLQSVYTQSAEGRSFDEESLAIEEQSLTIGELNQTAIVMTYVPVGAECGSAFDELWVRAADQGVGGNDGTGDDTGSGFGSNTSDSSRILRVQFDVKCTDGTRHLTPGQEVTVYAAGGLAGLVALASLVAFLASWNTKAVARAQPHVTLMIGIGALLLVGATMLRFVPPSPTMCDMRRAAVTLAFLSMFGVCTAKTFRVFRLLIKIHINPSLRRVQFSELSMMGVVGALALIEAIILAAWSLASPSRLLKIPEPSDPMITHLVCDGQHHNIFMSVWLVFNAGVIGFTVYLAVVTRNVNSQQGESQWMSYALYLQTTCAILAGMVLFALDELPREQTLALSLIAFVAAGATPALTLGRRALLGLDLVRFVKSSGLGNSRYGGSSSRSRSKSRTASRSQGSIVDMYSGGKLGKSRDKRGTANSAASSARGRGITDEPGAAVATDRSFLPTASEQKSGTAVSQRSLKHLHTGSSASWQAMEKQVRRSQSRPSDSKPGSRRSVSPSGTLRSSRMVHPSGAHSFNETASLSGGSSLGGGRREAGEFKRGSRGRQMLASASVDETSRRGRGGLRRGGVSPASAGGTSSHLKKQIKESMSVDYPDSDSVDGSYHPGTMDSIPVPIIEEAEAEEEDEEEDRDFTTEGRHETAASAHTQPGTGARLPRLPEAGQQAVSESKTGNNGEGGVEGVSKPGSFASLEGLGALGSTSVGSDQHQASDGSGVVSADLPGTVS